MVFLMFFGAQKKEADVFQLRRKKRCKQGGVKAFLVLDTKTEKDVAKGYTRILLN